MSYYSSKELSKLGFKALGRDVCISRKASIYGAERIEVGACSRIDDFCVLSAGNGGIAIGRNVHIAVMSTLFGRGGIEIHDFAGISSRVSIYSSSDDYSGEHMTNPTIPEKFTHVDHRSVVIGKHVIIGSGSVVLPGVTIGKGVAVGALALVKENLAPFGIYTGNPLRRLGDRKRGLLNLEHEYLQGSSDLV